MREEATMKISILFADSPISREYAVTTFCTEGGLLRIDLPAVGGASSLSKWFPLCQIHSITEEEDGSGT